MLYKLTLRVTVIIIIPITMGFWLEYSRSLETTTLISISLGQDDVKVLNTEVQVPSVHEDKLTVPNVHNFPEWKSVYRILYEVVYPSTSYTKYQIIIILCNNIIISFWICPICAKFNGPLFWREGGFEPAFVDNNPTLVVHRRSIIGQQSLDYKVVCNYLPHTAVDTLPLFYHGYAYSW